MRGSNPLFVCILAGCMSLTACGVNPVTGKRELQLVSETQEIAIGKENYVPAQQSQDGDYRVDPELIRYVQEVGGKLARVSDRPQLPYEFVILNNSVPNAWALPGGKIAVNRGLLLELNNEAELAAVLGHEITHAAARHGAQGMERGMLLQIGVAGLGLATKDKDYSQILVGAAAVGASLISQKYSRSAELEADRFGMNYMARAGYDSKAAIQLQETFVRLSQGQRQDWLSGMFASHPPSQERVDTNRKTAAKLPAGTLGAEAYQKKMLRLKRTKPAYDDYDKAREVFNKQQYDQAMKLVDHAIQIEPDEALFYGLLGDIYNKQNRIDLALQQYNQALSRNDQFFSFHLRKGLIQQQRGEWSNAKTHLERSIKLLPNSLAYKALGDIALRENDIAKARQYYQAGSDSQSESGKAAAAALARLELPEQPGKYIHVGGTLDKSGMLYIVVENQSEITVTDIELELSYAPGGVDSRRIHVSEALKPKQKTQVAAALGPFSSQKQLANVKVNVLGAKVP